MLTNVHKIGGSIIGNTKLLRNVLLSSNSLDSNQLNVFVVSALNATPDKTKGTTNLLASTFGKSMFEKINVTDKLMEQHEKIYSDFGISMSNETVKIINEAFYQKTLNETIEVGELISQQMFCDVLTSMNIDSEPISIKEIFRETDIDLNRLISRVDLIEKFKKSINYTDNNCVKVFPGFFHIGRLGTFKTLGRGYSDTTGALCSAVFNADTYNIWKESGGVFSAHPGKYQDAKHISVLSLEEAREITVFGNDVLHPLTAEFLREQKVNVYIKDANTERNLDTYIDISNSQKPYMANPNRVLTPIKAIACKSNLCILDYKISNNNTGFKMPYKPILLNATRGNISSLVTMDEYYELSNIIGNITSTRFNRSLIACVGTDMQGVVGLASRIMNILASVGVNIEMISQGPDEISIVLVVMSRQERLATHALHSYFFQKN